MRNKIILSMNCPKCGAKVKEGASFCPKCGNKLSQPSNKTPFQIFKEGCGLYKRLDDNVDVLVYPINESYRSIARTNFGVDREEEILMIRDTSFWSTKNQGTVLTDKGIHIITDNDNINDDTTINWSWDIISKVEYQEQYLYFYDYQGNYCNIGMSYFLKDGSNENIVASVGRQLASLFTKMAQATEPQASDFDICNQEIGQLCEANKYKEAAQRLQQCAIEQPEYASSWYEWLGRVYQYGLSDYQCAIKAYHNALNEANLDNTEWVANVKYRLYNAYLGQANNTNTDADIEEIRRLALYAALHGDDKEILYTNDTGESFTIKQDATNDFYSMDNFYRDNFLEYPYNKRKILYVVKQYTDLEQDVLKVIRIDNLPMEIAFPMGHPIANQLYIGHPLLRHKYSPFENYQLELIEDKVREFCSIVQALGATEINIECQNSNSGDYSTNGKRHIEGNAGHKMVDVSGSYHNEYSRRLIEELNHSIQLHQTFTPSAAPSLPEDLIWYDNEPSWQRLYKQRMTGSLLTHEERIETRKSQMVESNEMTEITGEVKTLFSSAGGSWTKNEESKYQIQENAVLSIKVTFAPMSQLSGGHLPSQQAVSQSSEEQQLPSIQKKVVNGYGKEIEVNVSEDPQHPLGYIKAEQEYIDELKECLADGELGGSERRLLNKLRIKLGISEERATELEAFLQKPQLTEEEQEYLEAYQDAMEDGVISDKERRLLDKLMKINNISEQRAKEIEHLNK